MKRVAAWGFALAFICSHALAAEPVAATLAKGDTLDQQLKTRDALNVYLEAEKTAPGDAEVLRRVAKAYAEAMPDITSVDERRTMGEKSVDYAKRAVAADGKNAMAHLTLAICAGRVAPLLDNKTKVAYSKLVKEQVDQSLALDPSDDYAYHVLGAWNYEIAGLNPILRALAKMIYGALPNASYEDAVKNFKKALELAPNRVVHHVELGRTYAAMGQTELARTEINKGLALPTREKDDPGTKERGRLALQKL